ncbi:hypothetical protein ACFL59_08965 [Planctomycetota bacterium]
MDRTYKKQLAAYLETQKVSQARSAEYLGLSQGHVARLLKEAEKDKILVRVRESFFKPVGIDPDRLRKIEGFLVPKRLRERLADLDQRKVISKPQTLSVQDSGSDDTAPTAWEKRLSQFGRAAARVVGEQLVESSVCGIAWGGTIGSLVDGLWPVYRNPPRKESPISFVATVAEPLSSTFSRSLAKTSSTALADRLALIFNGETEKSFGLRGIPAIVPWKFRSSSQLAVIRRYIECSESYLTVFGERTSSTSKRRKAPLVERMDTILTSAGTPGFTERNEYSRELLYAWGDQNRAVLGWILGDIGGVLVPREEFKDRKEFQRIADTWTGITYDEYERCAAKARKSKRPGVVLTAIGGHKAALVLEVLRRGLVNVLVIDQNLARELNNLCAEELEAR